jgi:hypothetical protein
MPTTYKILGQITGSSNTGSLSSVYTVPGATQAVVSSLVAANRSFSNTSYYIAVVPNGQSLSNQHYVAFNVPISGSDSTALTLGITMGAGDSIQVTGLATGSFSVFGSEIS